MVYVTIQQSLDEMKRQHKKRRNATARGEKSTTWMRQTVEVEEANGRRGRKGIVDPEETKSSTRARRIRNRANVLIES